MKNSENKTKRYAIIGFGNIGKAMAKAFARNHIQVAVATTRAPESFAVDAAAIGPEIVPVTLGEAVKADVILLAVRFQAYADVASQLPDWQGKIIVDLTNAYGVSNEQLKGLPSGKVIEDAFVDAKLVKAFNHLPAALLAQDPSVGGGRRVIFLTGDYESAIAEISDLTEDLGFAPVNLGRLAEGGMLVHGYGNTWGRLIFNDLVKLN